MKKLKTLDDFKDEVAREMLDKPFKELVAIPIIVQCCDIASQRYAKYIAIEFAKWRSANRMFSIAGMDFTFDQEFDQFIKERS